MVLDLNLPDVVAEVTELCERYERALVANDVSALKAFFWRSERAIRFGVTEELYGADEIDSFRSNRKVNYSDRKVLRQDVVALGQSLAIATLEFSVAIDERVRHGRQTQVWAKLDDAGWQIVSAHVSHRVEAMQVRGSEYIDAAAALLEIPIDPAFRQGVAANLASMARIAQPLLTFQLPPESEPAAIFEP